MDLSIIIVNWNSAHYVRKCLNSIYRNITDLDFEVIVVDNASYEGSDRIIHEEFPKAKYVQSEKNLGFAAANNLGYEHACGNAVLFLNPDTEVVNDAIQKMLHALYSLSDVGIVGCRLLNSDLSVQTSCIQPFPTILNQVMDAEVLKNWMPMAKIWGMSALYTSNSKPVEVEAVSGACIMTKRDTFDSVNHFSADYFMYSEDIDLCMKAKQKGLKVYFVGNAEVIHHGGGSSKKQDISLFGAVQMRESIYRFLTKTKGKPYAYMYRTIICMVSICRIMAIALIVPLVILSKEKNGFYQSLRKWKGIMRWSLGLEAWVR